MIRNPFRVTEAPDHMVRGRRMRNRHIAQTLALMTFTTLAAIAATPLAAFLFKYGLPMNRQVFAVLLGYLKMTLSNDGLRPHYRFLHDPDALPKGFQIVPGHDETHLKAILAYTASGLVGAIAGGLRQLTNPHHKMVMKQNAAWCTVEDLKEMEAGMQFGIRNGYLGALGRWPTGLRKGQMVRMIETLSCLCLAPPGTGKTAGLVVPTLMSCPGVSMVVNDPKPELYDMTGAERATCSNIFMLNWSKVDEPEKGVFYPRYNFLSPTLVPPDGPDRDTYLDSIAKTLIPDTGKGDSYFVNKGRAALTGFMHLIVARVNDGRDWTGMPTQWMGREASFPMLADWLAQAQFAAGRKGSTDDDDYMGPEDERPAPAEPDADVMKSWLKEITGSVDPSVEGPGRSQRAFSELATLIEMADKERSGILGTMDEAMLSFKNAAVKQRTSSCDFTADDLRGILDPGITARTKLPKDDARFLDTSQQWRTVLDKDDPDYLNPKKDPYCALFADKANWRPVTLYVCINQADAKAFSTITALLFETLSLSLLAYEPGARNPKTGRYLGPFAVLFLLDEFAKLPKIDAVIEGPDLARSKKLAFYLVAQDWGQIEKIYGKDNCSIIETTTAAKIIFSQNGNDTTEKVIKSVGQTTIRRASTSAEQGLHVQHIWKQNQSDQHEETNFLRTSDITSMERGTHLLIIQAFNTRPMKVRTPLFFLDPEIRDKVRARGKGPIARDILPRHVQKNREDEWALNQRVVFANQMDTILQVDRDADLEPEQVDELE